MSFQTKSSECWVTVESTPGPHTYIPLRETLFYPSCLLSTVTVTSSDSNYSNRSAPLKRVRLKSTEADEYDSLHSGCTRTRQSPYAIVADGGNEGGTICLKTGFATESGRIRKNRTFQNLRGLNFGTSQILVFGCLRDKDVVGSKKKVAEKIPGTKRYSVLLTATLLGGRRQPATFVPTSAHHRDI